MSNPPSNLVTADYPNGIQPFEPSQAGFTLIGYFKGPWKQRPTTNIPVGAIAQFTDIGTGNTLWGWDSVNSFWKPIAATKYWESTSLITGLQQTAEQILTQFTVPAGLLTGKVWRMLLSWGRDNTTDNGGIVSLRIGTTGTLADTQVTTSNLAGSLTGTTRSVGEDTWFRSGTSTQVEKLGTANFNASFSNLASGATLVTPVTISNQDTNDLILSLTTTMSAATATKPQLGYSCLEIQP